MIGQRRLVNGNKAGTNCLPKELKEQKLISAISEEDLGVESEPSYRENAKPNIISQNGVINSIGLYGNGKRVEENSRFSQDLELVEHVIHSPLDYNFGEDGPFK